MLILVSGLPGSGKSSFSDAMESDVDGFTHVPLDKYIKEVPAGISFLDWVDSPACVDWELLHVHLKILKDGKVCFTPQPDWNAHGKRISEGGVVSGGRRMQPARIAYVVPGCHTFRIPEPDGKYIKVFMETSHETITDRLNGRLGLSGPACLTLEKHLSKNWRDVEDYMAEADLVIPGTDDRGLQIKRLLDLIATTAFRQ